MRAHLWTLTLLYFLQGLPYGIQAKFLPIVLRGSGVSLTVIGLYKFLFLPWTVKVLWAPYVDRYGTKKAWLVGSLACLAAACWLTVLVELTDVVGLALVLLCQNFFASLQDIAVDAIAIAALRSTDLGLGNTAQVVGYKFGGLLGGAFFLMLHEAAGHRVVFAAIGGIYLVACALAAMWQAPPSGRRAAESSAQPCEKSPTAPSSDGKILLRSPAGDCATSATVINPASSIRSALEVGGTSWMLTYVILYKLGENGALSLLPMFLVDQKVSQASVGFWTGVVGSAATIVGSCVGGWLLSPKRPSAFALSSLLSWVRFAIVALETVLVTLLQQSSWFAGSHLADILLCIMCVQLFVSGITTTLTFGWMMSCSQMAPADAQATHYSILASAEVVGKLVCVSLDGLVADTVGYRATFVWFALLSATVGVHLRGCPSVLRGASDAKAER